MPDPVYWPSIAMAVAAVVLTAGVLCVRARLAGDVAASELRKLGRIGTVFPGIVMLLAVASAAQTFFPPLGGRHGGARRSALHLAREAIGVAIRSDASEDDLGSATNTEPLVSREEYAMATGQHDLTLTPLADSEGLVRLGAISKLAPMPRLPISYAALLPMLLRQASEAKQQEDALAEAIAAELASGLGDSNGVGTLDAGGSGSRSGTASSLGLGGTPAPPLLLGGALPFTNVAPAVPEPSTWATMVLGFAACGLALRRARRDRGSSGNRISQLDD